MADEIDLWEKEVLRLEAEVAALRNEKAAWRRCVNTQRDIIIEQDDQLLRIVLYNLHNNYPETYSLELIKEILDCPQDTRTKFMKEKAASFPNT